MRDDQLNVGFERMKKINEKREERKKITYEEAKRCPSCGANMKYIYGETYECPECGRKELSDFGKVKEFLDANGPQPAAIISDATGVSLYVIDTYLKQGRVEIPDGSDVYIRCQNCGTEIRYGRFCPECMMKMTNNLSKAIWNPDMGEKPKLKRDASGRMHTLDSLNHKNGKNNKR